MKLTFNYLLRALCLLVFAAALAKLAGLLPGAGLDHAPMVAGLLLALHAAELLFVFKLVRLYQGALAVSVLLTLLFGLLHWKPLAFEMGPNDQRYEVMALLDTWTNAFAAPDPRVSGTGGGRFLLVGSTWQGTLPPGLQLLRSPTRTVWLIGRTQTNGKPDFGLVHRLQDGVGLRRLSAAPAAEPAGPGSGAPPASPLQQMQAMDTEVFFTRLAALMVDNPPCRRRRPDAGPTGSARHHTRPAPARGPARPLESAPGPLGCRGHGGTRAESAPPRGQRLVHAAGQARSIR